MKYEVRYKASWIRRPEGSGKHGTKERFGIIWKVQGKVTRGWKTLQAQFRSEERREDCACILLTL